MILRIYTLFKINICSLTKYQIGYYRQKATVWGFSTHSSYLFIILSSFLELLLGHMHDHTPLCSQVASSCPPHCWSHILQGITQPRNETAPGAEMKPGRRHGCVSHIALKPLISLKVVIFLKSLRFLHCDFSRSLLFQKQWNLQKTLIWDLGAQGFVFVSAFVFSPPHN